MSKSMTHSLYSSKYICWFDTAVSYTNKNKKLTKTKQTMNINRKALKFKFQYVLR